MTSPLVSAGSALKRARFAVSSLSSSLLASAEDVEEFDFLKARAVLLGLLPLVQQLGAALLTAHDRWPPSPSLTIPCITLQSVRVRADELALRLRGLAFELAEHAEQAPAKSRYDLVGDIEALAEACRLDLHALGGLVEVLTEPLAVPAPQPEACPGCGVTDFPHGDGCPHEAELAAAAARAARENIARRKEPEPTAAADSEVRHG